jgi:hypothetical protein
MKKLLVLILAMAIAGSAFAVVDPDANSVGFYSDMTADTVTIMEAAPYSTHNVYAILTMPAFDELYGFELGYDTVGSAIVLSSTFANPQALDVGGPGNHIVGFGAPTACTEATLLMTLSVLYTDTAMGPVTMTLTGTEPSSINPLLPTLLLANGELITGGDSTDIGNVNFGINGVEEIVATEPATFDSVKSLYR